MQTRVYRTKSGAEYTLTQTKAPAEKPARKKAAKAGAKKPAANKTAANKTAANKQAPARRRVRKIVKVAVLMPKPAKAKDGQQMKLWG